MRQVDHHTIHCETNSNMISGDAALLNVIVNWHELNSTSSSIKINSPDVSCEYLNTQKIAKAKGKK